MDIQASGAELKNLKDEERQFVDCVVYEGLTKVEAYRLVYNCYDMDDKEAERKALKLFYQPNVNKYYETLMQEIRLRDQKKGIWTKERATDKLVRLIEKAETEIYDEDKQLTMSRMNAILLPIKELNTMNGYNTTSSVNVEGCVVQISGEGDLKD